VHHTLYVELHVTVQGLHFGTLCVQWLDVISVSNTLSLIHYYIRNSEHVQLLMGFQACLTTVIMEIITKPAHIQPLCPENFFSSQKRTQKGTQLQT